jgi:uncharacterized protein with GYD domain
MREAVDAAERLFPGYEQTGIAMAHTYIDQGREADNRLMERFDPLSGQIASYADWLVEVTARVSDGGYDRARALEAATQATLQRETLAIGAVGAVIMTVFAAIAYGAGRP